jgi:hypothetical protein
VRLNELQGGAFNSALYLMKLARPALPESPEAAWRGAATDTRAP